MKKYQIFTIVALLLLTFSYTIPIIGFNGIMERIKNHDTKDIPTYVAKIWIFITLFNM